MSDMDQILKQANEMQQKMADMQAEVEKMQTIGEAGNGLLKVILNGNRRINRVFLDPRLLAFLSNADVKSEGEGETGNAVDVVQSTLLQAGMSDAERKEMLEELIASAVNDGTEKIEREIQGKIAEMTKDIQLPEGFGANTTTDGQGSAE
jgi:DNA-binding protein YbaB